MKASWWLITTGVLQGSVSGIVLFNTFINYIDKGIECIPSKSADNARFGVSEGRRALQRDLERSDQFAETSCHVLHLHYNNPMQCYMLK